MTPLAVFLPVTAASVRYIAHEQLVDGQTLMERLARSLRQPVPGQTLVLIHQGPASGALRSVADRVGCLLVEQRGRSRLRMLETLMCDLQTDEIMFGTPELGLAPHTLLRQHAIWHRSAGIDYSAAVGVPAEAGSEVISLRGVQTLLELNVPGAPATPAPLVRALEQIGGAAQFGLRTGYFDGRRAVPGAAADLPATVTLTTPEDVDCAAAALRAAALNADGWDSLRAWRTLRVSQLERSRYRAAAPRRSAGRPQRVLFVSNPSSYSGAEESLCEVIRHLDPQRYTPSALIALEGRFAQRAREAGAAVTVPNRDFGRDWPDSYHVVSTAIDRHKPDVIHINAPSGLPLIYAAWQHSIPLVPHVRQPRLMSWVPLLQAAQQIIAVSRFIRGRIADEDVDPACIRVVYDGIDRSRFYPDVISRSDARTRTGVGAGIPMVLCVTRYVREKRLDLFCRTIGSLRSEFPSLQAVIVGDPLEGPEVASEVSALVAQLELTGTIRGVGFQVDVRPWMRTADVIVLCSDDEPLGTCILEAMALGTPAVVTRSGGLAEIIDEYGGALLVPPGDAAALADAVRRVLIDHDLRGKLREGGQAAIAGTCDVAVAAAGVMDVLDAALLHQPSSAPSYPHLECLPN